MYVEVVLYINHLVSLGLCGNYNMVLADDMKTPQGSVEGTAVSFSNSWKTNQGCPDRKERLEDPCSLSMENGKLNNYNLNQCKIPTHSAGRQSVYLKYK